VASNFKYLGRIIEVQLKILLGRFAMFFNPIEKSSLQSKSRQNFLFQNTKDNFGGKFAKE
jgi:hypothetical protein